MVRVGSYKRNLILPQSLKRMNVREANFARDHLEILFDLDIEARRLAEEQGMAFARTEMPNADTAFTAMLADVVHRHLAEREAAIP